MDLERFRKSGSGRLVKRRNPANGENYWAFLPNPLPPDLKWDNLLIRTLSKADRAFGELIRLGASMSNPYLLLSPLIRREAVLSSRIEGTRANLNDLYVYEARQLMLPGIPDSEEDELRDTKEVFNYVRALEHGIERLKTYPLNLHFIRGLHQILMEGVRGKDKNPGEFRSIQNMIAGPGESLEEARYIPPPPEELPQALEQFEAYLNTEGEYPPLVRLALLHYQFEALHPFIDGNGRVGRLLITLTLHTLEPMFQPMLYLSAYFENYRREYIDGLLSVSRDGNWRDWIIFFLRGVETQSREAVQKSRNLQDLQNDYRARAEHAHPRTTIPLQIIDLLFDKPFITIRTISNYFGVAYQTASNNVNRLVEMEILRQSGRKERDRIFYAPEILEIIG